MKQDNFIKEIDISKLKTILSNIKVGFDIERIEPLTEGFQSQIFKLNSTDKQELILKVLKSNRQGFEYNERNLANLVLSQSMADKLRLNPKILLNLQVQDNNLHPLTELKDDDYLIQIMEYEPDGKSYWEMLHNKSAEQEITDIDKKEIKSVLKFLIKLQNNNIPKYIIENTTMVAKDAWRNLITNPELALALLSDFGDNHSVLPRSKHGELIGLMIKDIYRLEGFDSKLVCVHGDFWGANFYFKKDGSNWVIDYSRIPYGDPAIDVGWWVSQYIWLFIKTKKNLYKQLLEFFIDQYISQTGDKTIKERLPLVITLLMIINISPKLYTLNEESIKAAKEFYNFAVICLDQGKLVNL